jgi:hypothetical protein
LVLAPSYQFPLGDRKAVDELTTKLVHMVIDRQDQIQAHAEAIKLLAKCVPLVAFVNNISAEDGSQINRSLGTRQEVMCLRLCRNRRARLPMLANRARAALLVTAWYGKEKGEASKFRCCDAAGLPRIEERRARTKQCLRSELPAAKNSLPNQ